MGTFAVMPLPPALRRVLKGFAIGVGGLVGLLLVIQVVPFGRDHTNPPVRFEPPWDSPRTRELAVRACFDCHSNETKWPWYSHVAPMSWVLQNHVTIGRSVLNFSEWDRLWPLAEQAASQTIRREMPPRSYRMLHPESVLSQQENVELARGLAKTLNIVWRED
jgi:hypothetical protein